LALPFFAVTLFVSAFLLFLVQPIIGKLILPRLGGTPQVWNTCMVFFQTALLAGYAYTHTVSTRLPLRKQLLVHGLLLFVPFIILFAWGEPFSVEDFVPPPGANPIPYTLFYLTLIVGLPFFVVATSAPLLQKWFASTGHPAAKDPYFLYGASNLGSMLALIAYPFLVEPMLLLHEQSWTWTVGYGVLLLFVLGCALLVLQSAPSARLATPGAPALPTSEADPIPPTTPQQANAPQTEITASPPPPGPAPSAAKSTAIKKGGKHQHKQQRQQHQPRRETAPEPAVIHRPSDEMTPWRRLRWVAWAAIPSSMMLGVTTHITTDLSPIPLFWLVPLTLYLLSFILVFSRWPVVWTGEPHTVMLYLQPVLIALMIFVEVLSGSGVAGVFWWSITFNVLAFFATALVCHGELARDRPSTKHLTEFYLWMSVGGMVGGMFNGLIAPVLFTRLWEFPIAVILAGLLRPTMKESGWTDEMAAGFLEPQSAAAKGKHTPRHAAKGELTPSFHTTMDVVLPVALTILIFLLIFPLRGLTQSLAESFSTGRGDRESVSGMQVFLMFGLPLAIACLYFGRPLRFGLAIAGVLIAQAVYLGRGDTSIYESRSYFGIIRVKENAAGRKGPGGETKYYPYTQLIHGHINHGMNFHRPKDEKLVGNPKEDFSRLATTYYHRLGPAGVVMEKFNWWPREENTYHADARMPASLVGLTAGPLGTVSLPTAQLTGLWSEPAFATIGQGTATMASYARPYQHCHYYEIDSHIRKLSLPWATGKEHYVYFTHDNVPRPDAGGKQPFFTYLQSAILRGSEIQVLMGDARLRMAQEYENHHVNWRTGGGPESFYHMMVVDAFTSDAIPAHLITKQAIQMYFKKLTEEGILCVHTSNRYVDLPKVVADVATHLGYAYKRGHDNAPNEEMGHFTSEWVMVARKPEYLRKLSELEPPNYMRDLVEHHRRRGFRTDNLEQYWTVPAPTNRHVWTDSYTNLWAVIK
jgi:hypothetical protein